MDLYKKIDIIRKENMELYKKVPTQITPRNIVTSHNNLHGKHVMFREFHNQHQRCITQFQVYGTRDTSKTDKNLLTNGLDIGEDSHLPVHLQLSQPQQEIYETTARSTNLEYVSLHKAT